MAAISRVHIPAEREARIPSHSLECEVFRTLREHPQVRIASLVVRRIPQGVCLQGVLESDPVQVNLQQLLREIDGVEHVVNQLVTCPKKMC